MTLTSLANWLSGLGPIGQIVLGLLVCGVWLVVGALTDIEWGEE